jgi:hypothetical protein
MAGGLMSNEVRPPIDIGGASKSRPGPLDPDEIRRPPVNVQPRGSGNSGGGTSWMPAIIAIVVSVIASAVMVFMFNPAKAGVETLSNQVIQLDQRMSTMEGYATKIDKIDDIDTSLNQLLATSAGYVTQDDLTGITNGMASEDQIASLQASIDTLNTTNADLLARLEALEEETTSPDGGVILGEVRWTPSVSLEGTTLDGNIGDLDIDIDTDERIMEEGLYNIDVVIENTGNVDITNLRTGIKITLSPRDDALVDEDATYLDSDNSPWLDWEADYLVREREGTDVTKRIYFECDKYTFGTLVAGDTIELELVLELYYE